MCVVAPLSWVHVAQFATRPAFMATPKKTSFRDRVIAGIGSSVPTGGDGGALMDAPAITDTVPLMALVRSLVESRTLALPWSEDDGSVQDAVLGTASGDRPSVNASRTRIRVLAVAATARFNPRTHGFVADLGTCPHLIREGPVHHGADVEVKRSAPGTYCEGARIGFTSSSGCECRAIIHRVAISQPVVGWEFPDVIEAAAGGTIGAHLDDLERSQLQVDRIKLMQLAHPLGVVVAQMPMRPRMWLSAPPVGGRDVSHAATGAYLCDAWGGAVQPRRSDADTVAHADPTAASARLEDSELGASVPFRDVFLMPSAAPTVHADRTHTVLRNPYPIPPELYFMWCLKPGVPPAAQIVTAYNASSSQNASAIAAARVRVLIQLAKHSNETRLPDGSSTGQTRFNPRAFNTDDGDDTSGCRMAAALLYPDDPNNPARTAEQRRVAIDVLAQCTNPAPIAALARAVAAVLFPVWVPGAQLRVEFGLTRADALLADQIATVSTAALSSKASRGAARGMASSTVTSSSPSRISAQVVLRFTAFVTVRFVHCDP